MLVRTNDTGSFWTLGPDLLTWTLLDLDTPPPQYLAVDDIAARNAIPALDRTEGMLVRTNDTGDFWTLGSDLLTWTLLVVNTTPPQYLAVANIAARNAIPALDRVEGMLVRTNDTDLYWTLEADLTTWTAYEPSQYRAVADTAARNAIPAANRLEGLVVRTNDSGLFWVLAADLTTWTQVDAAVQLTLSNILSTIGTIPASTSLAGLLTNTTNYFPFVNLPDVTPRVVETVNTLNEQVGNRDYTGPHLTDGQTITASLQALSAAVGSGGFVATQVGQTLWSVDGVSFSRQLPLTSVSLDRGGWLLNDQGYMLVTG